MSEPENNVRCERCTARMDMHYSLSGLDCPILSLSDGAIQAFYDRMRMLCTTADGAFDRRNINRIPWFNNKDFFYAFTTVMMLRRDNQCLRTAADELACAAVLVIADRHTCETARHRLGGALAAYEAAKEKV